MKSMPQHACEACNELVATIRQLKHEFQRVKRLPAAEMAAELNLLQASKHTTPMKVTCYLQIVPKYSSSGAHVINLELDVPETAFKATKISAAIPLEKLVPAVTAEVK